MDVEQEMKTKYVINENKRSVGVAKYSNRICITLTKRHITVKIVSSVDEIAINKLMITNMSIISNIFLVTLYSPILLIIVSNIGR